MVVCLALAGLLPLPWSRSMAAPPVDFDREVRPILADRCFACHGPDENERQADLRLDLPEELRKPADSGRPAVVPGKPDESGLIRRINSTRKGFLMPPPESGKTLSPAEKDVLRRWVEEGAPYKVHWSFVAPDRPEVPGVTDSHWPRGPIDRFLLARLEAAGLHPAPEADRTTLIRRVTLDLTGLPPTPAEVDAFLADQSPDAYETLVDRLLASPRFGERMALDWLDAARFADTHGYHLDSGRDMTRWRAWVIDAFNRNMPFDQFTIEQLAGDLLPGATLAQKIASGFNRNHMINYEGGAIPAEYQTAYIVDRVNTTGTVWLGLTIGCAQCHDHKFDPISQREYYQLYAFYHNVAESGLDGKKGNAAPMLKLPTADQQARRDRLVQSIAALERRLAEPSTEFDAAQVAWEAAALGDLQVEWTVLDPSDLVSLGRATLRKRPDRSIVAEGENPAKDTYQVLAPVGLDRITAVRLEALPDDSLSQGGPGRSDNGNMILTEVRLALTTADDPAHRDPVAIKAASADFSQAGFPVAAALDGKSDTGWAIGPRYGKPHSAVFELERPLEIGCCELLAVTLEFQSSHPRHQLGRFRISAATAKDPRGTQRPPARLVKILERVPDERSDAEQADLRRFFRTKVSAEGQHLSARLAEQTAEQETLEARIPSTMVMEELPKPRETFILERGQYDQAGEKVGPDVPASLPSLFGDEDTESDTNTNAAANPPPNRLALAKWLMAPGHPLVSRVIVNRYWQMFFGTGIVKTAEDFGAQGELPSHPELLDWLAVSFSRPESGPPWDIKALVRRLVTSAAYRQASVVTPALLAVDPENRLLGRGPRLRLPAEFIRDQALAVSGLLDGRIGGNSVSPYQPAGLWEELASRLDGSKFTAQTYVQSHGSELYRRTMYTFWKRTSPPPALATFDAPDRETCTVRRARTNTPLQALVLLNDPTYVEAARKLAERLMTETPSAAGPAARISLAFRLALARPPRPAELAALRDYFDKQWSAYRADPAAAHRLLEVGESPRDGRLDAPELAAWTMVASTILNLDETMTKN
jgi:hypothetical protein